MKPSFFVLFSVLFLTFPLFSYNDCLNEEQITENCIRDLFKANEFALAASHIDQAEFASKTDSTILKIELFMKLAKYDETEKLINSLPNDVKNTLYYKLMLVKTFVARKRFNQALEIIDEIKSSYQICYLFSDLECLKGDIALYRKQYDSAIEFYDRCLDAQDNGVAAFNRILALEKNGEPQVTFLKDYVEYIDSYGSLSWKSQIVDRLVKLKKNKGVPNSSSPYYVRWLSIMRRENRLSQFFTDEYLTLPFPANLEIADYLISAKRYSDALKMLDNAISKQTKANDAKYKLVNKKYRVLNQAGREIEAADFLLKSSDEFAGTQKDRMKFLSALVYFENGMSEKSKEILTGIVAMKQNSKYFMLSLYKLGLIYLFEGNDLYAFTMWSEFLLSEKMNYDKFVDGKGSYEAITGLTSLLDRINGYCAALSDVNFQCSVDENGISESVNSFISYYDFTYFHIIERDEFKKKPDFGNVSATSQKWLANKAEIGATKEEFIEAVSQLHPKIKKREPAFMIDIFLKADDLDGVEFYVDMMRIYTSYNESKHAKNASSMKIPMPEAQIIDEFSSNYKEILSKIHLVYNKFFKKTAKVTSYYYNQLSPDLTYSPHYGKKEDWRLLYPTPYLEVILKLAGEFNVPVQLIYSIMRAETYYRESLSSNVGALGLMQIMPQTFEKISKFGGIKIHDPMDPYDSMKASVWYLSKLLKRFDNNLIAATAAYNAGPHNVSDWISRYGGKEAYLFVEMIPFKETRDYVKKVMRFYMIYSYIYEDEFFNVGLNGVYDVNENSDVVNF
ncbi:transglycosylase SLT domain-containing protein [bacterium]|nr:transglycosylase SLT domain-containing protein [bacterium]